MASLSKGGKKRSVRREHGRAREQRLKAQSERRARLIEQIREDLLERLDRAALNGPMKELLERLFPDDGLAVFQEIAFALFVESFVKEPELAGRIEGLISSNFGRGIEVDGIEAFAEMISRGRGRGKANGALEPLQPLPIYPSKNGVVR